MAKSTSSLDLLTEDGLNEKEYSLADVSIADN